MPTAASGVDDVTRRLLEQTLIPSPNVTALVERKASGFVDRLRPEAAGGRADIAELFHVNSKLSRHLADIRFTDAEIAAVRNWYLASCGRVREEDLTSVAHQIRLPHTALPAPVHAVLSPFGPDGPLTPLLYGVDLGMILLGGTTAAPYAGVVCRQAPGSDALWVEQQLGEPDLAALRRAVPGPAADLLVAPHPIFVVTAVPWRTMLFSGPRGYRRMLMDAGVLINALGSAAVGNGLSPRPILDFYDDELDELLGNDGVERSVLALLVLVPPVAASPGSNGKAS
jgi:hypothetical protein